MTRFRIPALLALIVLILLTSALSQMRRRGQITAAESTNPQAQERTQMEAKIQQQLQHERMKKRAEDMKRDSQKLLELATELKKYVDKSGENVLSVDVVRKAEQMEKLARQVKNNMRAQ